MSPKLTAEMRAAFEAQPEGLVEVEDDQTGKVYFLIEQPQARRLLGDRLRRELQIGFDQADRDESQPWDIRETLAEAHRRHAEPHD
jgi:hypothetical protein